MGPENFPSMQRVKLPEEVYLYMMFMFGVINRWGIPTSFNDNELFTDLSEEESNLSMNEAVSYG